MKNIITGTSIILLLLVSFLIAGCQFRSDSEPGLNVNYRSGTQGLKMTFIENMPTKSLYAGERFSIGINLENMGAHGINDGIITISGYERNQYSFAESHSRQFELRGRTQFEPKGEAIPMIFDVTSLCYPAMAQQRRTNLTTTFRATACYTYATVANAQVCINTNPLSSQTPDRKVCDVKAVTLSGGQGGPMAVTKVVPSMIPTGSGVLARFQIHIRNMGTDGTVYSFGAVDSNCEDHTLQNKVTFGASLSDIPMYCTPAGEIELRLGEDTVISCETELGTQGGVYETQLTMGMEYSYSQDVVTKVHVQKPLNVDLPACN